MPPNRKLAHGRPCPYCNRQMERYHRTLEPTRDHVVPKSRNGRVTIICCIQCNGIKGSMMPETWSSFMATYPKWWLLTKPELKAIRKIMRRGDPSVVIINGKTVRRQGSPPAKPVVVPPGLIWKTPELVAKANQLRPYERSQVLLQAERDAKRQEEVKEPR
jgi:hypothetical protein